jgi:phosphopentomutase
VGKISEVFLGRGVAHSDKTRNNAEGMQRTLDAVRQAERGLIFTNLVDFDMLYGHRNNVEGYAAALEAADAWLPELMAALGANDLLVVTADHGNDPTTPSTDHSREYVPLVVYGPGAKRGVDLGTRATLSDVGQTVAEAFETHLEKGTSFLEAIL